MGFINTMRNKMGRFVVVAVFLAIALFIFGDLTGPNSILFNKNDNIIAEISGEEIEIDRYNVLVDEIKYNFLLNNGRNPNNAELTSIRQQAWDRLFVEVAFQEQFEKIGLTVTEQEVVDMVQGKNVSPDIANAPVFKNPETGAFDRNMVVAYLQNINRLPPEQQAVWYQFEKSLAPSRLRLKYDNLLSSSVYASTEEAKKEYWNQNRIADLKYLYVPFYAVPDSMVEISENDLKEYLKENKDQYQVDATVDLRYVTFPIVPSAEDSAFYHDDIASLKTAFRDAQDDSLFAKLNTDASEFYFDYREDELPGVFTSIEVGTVVGPKLEEGAYKLFKISEKYQDSVFSIRASHILFKPEDESELSKIAARDAARRVLNEIKNGADFGEMAREHGMDGTAARGGDLGWFKEGRMVEEFNDAVFSFNGTGLLNELVETDFGYHIIKVTEPKTNTRFKVAVIAREIIARDETIDAAFRKADYFAGTNTNFSDMKAAAEKVGLNLIQANDVSKNQRALNNLFEAREVIRWAFNDASLNEVSTVFEVDNNYVVAALVDKTEDGTATVSDVRYELMAKVRNQKKGKYIKEKLENLSGTLDDIASAYGEDAKLASKADVKLIDTILPQAGTAPKAIGTAFALASGERSAPIIDEAGVVIVEVNTVTDPTEIADYSTYKNQLESRRKGRTSFNAAEAIREAADIKDYRYRFF